MDTARPLPLLGALDSYSGDAAESKSAAGILIMPAGACRAPAAGAISTRFCGKARHPSENSASGLAVILHLRQNRSRSRTASDVAKIPLLHRAARFRTPGHRTHPPSSAAVPRHDTHRNSEFPPGAAAGSDRRQGCICSGSPRSTGSGLPGRISRRRRRTAMWVCVDPTPGWLGTERTVARSQRPCEAPPRRAV